MGTWSRKTLQKFIFLVFVSKNDPFSGNFKNSAPKGYIATPVDLLCSHFVKFGRREVCEIGRCLPDKKKQNFAWLSSSRYSADFAQNLSRPAPDDVLRVLQMSSKSVHFRRSYSRTREHIKTGHKTVSNIRLKPSFERNKHSGCTCLTCSDSRHGFLRRLCITFSIVIRHEEKTMLDRLDRIKLRER